MLEQGEKLTVMTYAVLSCCVHRLIVNTLNLWLHCSICLFL